VEIQNQWFPWTPRGAILHSAKVHAVTSEKRIWSLSNSAYRDVSGAGADIFSTPRTRNGRMRRLGDSQTFWLRLRQ